MFARKVFVATWVSAILLHSNLVVAQESRAVVVGRITDSSGAVVPDAAVSLTNVETAVARFQQASAGASGSG